MQNPGFELLLSVISAKAYMNQPSSLNHLLPLNRNEPARTIVSSCLAGRFFVVQWRVLGWTYICTFGEASGFFVWMLSEGRFIKLI